MIQATLRDVIEIVNQPVSEKLTQFELKKAAKYLELGQEKLGEAWGELKPSLRRTRISVNGYMRGRTAISLELSWATRVLLARKIRIENPDVQIPDYLL